MKVKLNCATQPMITTEDLDSIGVIERALKPEEYMIYCARVSSPDNRLNHGTAPKLLKYLVDAGHWSPFEMISFGFEIETSRAIAQQILRHRSFSFQEFSQRYARVDKLEEVELRWATDKNRQSSTSPLNHFDVDESELLREVDDHLRDTLELYNRLVDAGLATETVRFILPLTTQTTIVMHGTLRSWIHFFAQRCDAHAQKEIQEIAFEIRNQLSSLVPWTAEALEWNK